MAPGLKVYFWLSPHPREHFRQGKIELWGPRTVLEVSPIMFPEV